MMKKLLHVMTNHLVSQGFAVPLAVLALIAGLLPFAAAQGPNNNPRITGTIKATLSTSLEPIFRRQMELIEGRRSSWLAKALQSTPKLIRTPKRPIAVINVARDATSFQGWRTVVNNKPESICNRPLSPGDSFILDFGEHITVLSANLISIISEFPGRWKVSGKWWWIGRGDGGFCDAEGPSLSTWRRTPCRVG
jgi:hypothetical protein